MGALIGFGSAPRDVFVQDQTTPTIILPMVRQLGSNALAAPAVTGDYTATVVSSAGMVIGNHFRIINATADRYYYGLILNIVGNVITLDTQIDFGFAAGSEVTYSAINMNVNGSVTPAVYKLRIGGPSIPSSIDITRIIFVCTAAGPVDLNKFGNLAPLTRGLAFRRVNGEIENIFNVKTNKDLAGIAYDFTPYVASNPVQAVDGFSCRLTFAGQNKMGVVLRVEAAGNLEMLVQDNLTGLVSLSVVLEGHVVQP